MLEQYDFGVSLDIIVPLYCLYRHLKVLLKYSNTLTDEDIPLYVRIKQGAITSLTIQQCSSHTAQEDLPI